jgi:hypothetical protein
MALQASTKLYSRIELFLDVTASENAQVIKLKRVND